MSLLGSIQLAGNTLRVNQLALEVIGQNVANANTEGYIREEMVLSPAGTEDRGGVLLGMGVQVEGVIQKIDTFLEERLRGSVSDSADIETRESVYQNLETVLGELTDSDLSTSLSSFFNSISDILNQPEDAGVRNLAIHSGETLADSIQTLSGQVVELRSGVTDRIIDAGDRINKLLEEITTLNVRIVTAEAGNTSTSDAVGLRDQRLTALEELAGIIDINVNEDSAGSVSIYCGGDYLVSGASRREVEVVLDSDRGTVTAEIQISATQSALDMSSGELQGLTTAQDEILGGFLDQLDEFAQTLIFEFNKQYSQGQGLSGYSELTSEFAVDDTGAALNEAGLTYDPTNGLFQVLVYNSRTGLTETTDVIVDLNGLGHDTTLDDLAAKLDAIEGIAASTTSTGKLTIAADDPDCVFSFASDTSGVLASLGLHTFFTGSSAQTIGVSQTLAEDPSLFAASLGGFGADTANAAELVELADRTLDTQQGLSITGLYEQIVSDTAQASSVTTSLAEGSRMYESTLRSQKTATSGVNLDEEAINLIAYQQAYQATARYISTLSELLEMVTQL